MKIRTALLITSVFVLFSFLTPVLTSSAVTHHKRSSLTVVYRQDEPTILHVERARLVAYATAVTANQLAVYSAAVVAAQRAAVVPPTAPVVAPAGSVYAEWTRVAVCEEGGWIGYAGPAYPDSLGISAQNWASVCPDLSWSSIDDNIECAERIQSDPPDQDGCNGSW